MKVIVYSSSPTPILHPSIINHILPNPSPIIYLFRLPPCANPWFLSRIVPQRYPSINDCLCNLGAWEAIRLDGSYHVLASYQVPHSLSIILSNHILLSLRFGSTPKWTLPIL